MAIYIVEYTNIEYMNQYGMDNQCLQMEIEAPNLETAYEIVNESYPDLEIDTIYPI